MKYINNDFLASYDGAQFSGLSLFVEVFLIGYLLNLRHYHYYIYYISYLRLFASLSLL